VKTPAPAAGGESAALTEGIEITRISRVDRPEDDVANEVTVRYALDEQDHRLAVTVSGARWDEDDPSRAPSPYAIDSAARYGDAPREVSTDVVCDTATAWMIATSIVRARAFPVQELEYESDQSLGWLRPGAIVSLTDADLSLSARRAIVLRRTWRLPTIEWVLGVIADPIRDTLSL
jgi:hypothetical protein